jgi:RecA/RadA recombinase
LSEAWRVSAVSEQCGVDVDNLILAEADSIESIFESVAGFVESLGEEEWRRPSIAVVDSITAVTTDTEGEKAFGDKYQVGSEAAVLRRCMKKKFIDKIADQNTLVVFVNHAISKIQTMGFGRTSEAAGGHAIKFYASLRVSFSFVSNLFEGKGDDKIRRGQVVNFNLEKNKVSATGSPQFKVELTEHGFDMYQGLHEAMLSAGLVEKIGPQTFKLGETQYSKQKLRETIDAAGGLWEVYNWFLTKCQENGRLKPYGRSEDE